MSVVNELRQELVRMQMLSTAQANISTALFKMSESEDHQAVAVYYGSVVNAAETVGIVLQSNDISSSTLEDMKDMSKRFAKAVAERLKNTLELIGEKWKSFKRNMADTFQGRQKRLGRLIKDMKAKPFPAGEEITVNAAAFDIGSKPNESWYLTPVTRGEELNRRLTGAAGYVLSLGTAMRGDSVWNSSEKDKQAQAVMEDCIVKFLKTVCDDVDLDKNIANLTSKENGYVFGQIAIGSGREGVIEGLSANAIKNSKTVKVQAPSSEQFIDVFNDSDLDIFNGISVAWDEAWNIVFESQNTFTNNIIRTYTGGWIKTNLAVLAFDFLETLGDIMMILDGSLNQAWNDLEAAARYLTKK